MQETSIDGIDAKKHQNKSNAIEVSIGELMASFWVQIELYWK